MPPDGHRYVVRNFAEQLHWRLVHFVDQLPPNRVCSACGIAVRRTGLLLCGHHLCEHCHRQQQGELAAPLCCPLDGEECPEESVQWRTFPASDLDRMVYCWNKDNGCSAVLPVGQLVDHCYNECGHHAVTCPKCSTEILYNSLCSHLRACTGTREPGATGNVQVSGDSQVTAELVALRTTLGTATLRMERQLGDLKGLLERLSLESSLETDHINELSHTVNDLTEVLTDQMSELSRAVISLRGEQTDRGNELSLAMTELKEALERDLETVACSSRDSTARQAEDFRSTRKLVAETGRDTFRKMDSILRHILRTQSSHQWTLTGYGSLKAKALRVGWAGRLTSAVHLCHYLISPGVLFEWDGYRVSLCMQLSLKKGEVDEYLQWPFNRKIALSVMHPNWGEKRDIQVSLVGRDHFYVRPTTPSNAPVSFPTCLYLDDLERDGFVENDQLELCFALLT